MPPPTRKGQPLWDDASSEEPRLATLGALAPRLIEGRRQGDCVRVWVAGCGDGLEVYAIGMLILEASGVPAGRFDVRLYGTDADPTAIGAARRGRYPAELVRGFSPERLDRFFIPVAGGYAVGPCVRDLAVFGAHELGRDPPFPSLDLVSCPTALTALGASQRASALESIHRGLRSGGVLLVGSTGDIAEKLGLFSAPDPARPLVRTKKPAGGQSGSFRLFSRAPAGAGVSEGAAGQRHLARELADRRLLETCAPASVVVDAGGRIVHARGNLLPYLTCSVGASGALLRDVVPAHVQGELGRGIDRALAGDRSVARAAILSFPPSAEAVGHLTVEISPLSAAPSEGRYALVVFRESGEARSGRESGEVRASPAPLDEQLAAAGGVLHRTIIELEASNEALAVANEELRASNRELLRLNGALDDSRADFRSLAEELGSVNGELRHRLAEITEEHRELATLLLHVRDAAMFVLPPGRIGRFTEAAARLFSLSPNDVGKSVEALGDVTGVPLVDLLAEVWSQRGASSRTATGPDGSVYVVSAEPPSRSSGGAGILLRFEKRAESGSR